MRDAEGETIMWHQGGTRFRGIDGCERKANNNHFVMKGGNSGRMTLGKGSLKEGRGPVTTSKQGYFHGQLSFFGRKKRAHQKLFIMKSLHRLAWSKTIKW